MCWVDWALVLGMCSGPTNLELGGSYLTIGFTRPESTMPHFGWPSLDLRTLALFIKIPKRWWESFRATTIWHIWLARNLWTIQGKTEHPIITKRGISNQVNLYPKSSWKRRKDQICEERTTLDNVAYQFRFNYGKNEEFFHLEGNKLWVINFAMEPD